MKINKDMSESGKRWFDAITWLLIYGGLLMIVAGFVVGDEQLILGWSLGALGSLATGAGIVMVYIRSRLKEQ